MIVKKEYKLNKEWLDLLLEHKNNENVIFNLSDNDTIILLTYIEILQQENARLKDKIDMAIEHYEKNQQECVIGRTKDDKLIKDYYLPAQCSKKMLDILKEN